MCASVCACVCVCVCVPEVAGARALKCAKGFLLRRMSLAGGGGAGLCGAFDTPQGNLLSVCVCVWVCMCVSLC